jgi:hypothetical protein
MLDDTAKVVSLDVVVTPRGHDALVGIAVEERVPVSAATMRIAEHAIARMVRGLVPEDVLLRDATEVWVSFDRIERLSAAAADHLAKLGGTTALTARRSLEASRQIADLPVVAETMRDGLLSSVQAEAVADAATADPSAAARLVRTAQSTNVGELRAECLRTKAAADPDPDATYRRIDAERNARFSTDREGARILHVRGTVDRVSRIENALQPLVDGLFQAAWAEGRREPREAYVFDALVMLSERDELPDTTKKRASKPAAMMLFHLPFEGVGVRRARR